MMQKDKMWFLIFQVFAVLMFIVMGVGRALERDLWSMPDFLFAAIFLVLFVDNVIERSHE